MSPELPSPSSAIPSQLPSIQRLNVQADPSLISALYPHLIDPNTSLSFALVRTPHGSEGVFDALPALAERITHFRARVVERGQLFRHILPLTRLTPHT